jgi:hypothetical protein
MRAELSHLTIGEIFRIIQKYKNIDVRGDYLIYRKVAREEAKLWTTRKKRQ